MEDTYRPKNSRPFPCWSRVASVSINVCRCVVVACDEFQGQVGEAKKN